MFDGNNLLGDRLMTCLDWGLFVRHDIDGQLIPFIFLYDGYENVKKITLMAEGDPKAFAIESLQKSETKFQQFVIGMEGYLRDVQGNRQDAIIVEGYDITKAEGYSLAQAFQPKENGGFKKIGPISFLGKLPLPISQRPVDEAVYESESTNLSGIIVNDDKGDISVLIASYANPTTLINDVKFYIRDKFASTNANEHSGIFRVEIAPQERHFFKELWQFVMHEGIKFEKNRPSTVEWETKQSKKLLIDVSYKGTKFIESNQIVDSVPIAENLAEAKTDEDATQTQTSNDANEKPDVNPFLGLDKSDLDRAYYEIVSIPNARTNIEALTKLTYLIAAYEAKNIAMPGDDRSVNKQSKSSAKPSKGNKSGCLGIIVILIGLLVFLWSI